MVDRPLVLYHANCFDGFCAAWIARRVLMDVELVPVSYGRMLSVDVTDRLVYILDFSYPRDLLMNMIERARFTTVRDHHKTAQAELAGLAHPKADILFDMGKSGARLTWEKWYPAVPAPWLVEYTEDRDLWRWNLPHSREVNTYLRSWPLEFNLWDELNRVEIGTDAWDEFVAAGATIRRTEQNIVADHIHYAQEYNLDGYGILVVNATVLQSEIAGRLAVDRPFGACYVDTLDGRRQWSLRSAPDGVDVSLIAKAHGGGGHKHAAGFEEKL
jgi:uncharacterized protein